VLHEHVVAWVDVESLSLDCNIRQIHAVVQHKVRILRNQRARQAQSKVVVIAEQNRAVPATANSGTGLRTDAARSLATAKGIQILNTGGDVTRGSPGAVVRAHEDALVAGLRDAVGALLETDGGLDGLGHGVA